MTRSVAASLRRRASLIRGEKNWITALTPPPTPCHLPPPAPPGDKGLGPDRIRWRWMLSEAVVTSHQKCTSCDARQTSHLTSVGRSKSQGRQSPILLGSYRSIFVDWTTVCVRAPTIRVCLLTRSCSASFFFCSNINVSSIFVVLIYSTPPFFFTLLRGHKTTSLFVTLRLTRCFTPPGGVLKTGI